ncbi:MAG: TonB-dependent receptor, partial [Deltaproteobacteria bacterium]|nr:TonB-dependent receptor [Deltaproteobacteria bacterium]
NRGRVYNNMYLRWVKSQFADPQGEIGLGATQDNDNNTVVFGDRLIWQTDFGKHFVLKKGAAYIHEWFLPQDYDASSPIGSASKRQQINFFLEPHFYLFDDKFTLSLLGESLNSFYNINNNDPSLATPGTFFSDRTENQFAATAYAKYRLPGDLNAKASLGRVVRLPRFIEMFGDQGNVVGNPALSSEKGIKFDLGFIWSRKFKGHVIRQATVEADYFESHLDDLIQFEMAAGYARAANIGKARIRGFELLVSGKIWKYFDCSANYTLQQAVDLAASGNDLVGRPRHELNTGVEFATGAFTAAADVNYTDGQYLDALNTQRINNRLLLNLNASYLIKEKYRISLEAKNLTNSQIVDAVGFPLPGRSFFGRVGAFF